MVGDSVWVVDDGECGFGWWVMVDVVGCLRGWVVGVGGCR